MRVLAQSVMATRSSNSVARCRRTPRGHSAERPVELKQLAAGEVGRKAVVLGQVAGDREFLAVAQRSAQHRAHQVVRANHRHHDLDQGALARSVRAEQAEYLAAADLHVHPAQSPDLLAIGLAHVEQIDGQVG